jgi:isopenicillin-N N-acyltransferase like protein
MKKSRGPRALRPRAHRKLRVALVVLLALVLAPIAGHFGVVACTRMEPPAITTPGTEQTIAVDDPERRMVGASYARRRGAIWEVRLAGDPVAIGWSHTKLLRDEQIAIEEEMRRQFAHFVPWSPARTLLVDMARLRFDALDQLLSPAYRQEIAAQAAAFGPDPFEDMMPTYQRHVFLHSLYDIMLSFERSPLIGCTSFVLREGEDGHLIMGRNFDFEGPQILDDKKAVFLVFEDGQLPYASVSWPGFIGTATGINREGVALVIHGARAGESDPKGEPVPQTFRDVLRSARSVEEAVAIVKSRRPIVPHMLLVADGAGRAVVIERVPHKEAFVREAGATTLPLTNHFEGPHAGDPKNLEVRERTSTLPRRERLDALLENVPAAPTVQHAVEILRDKRGPDGAPRSLGHRSSIDALIATHSVAIDVTAGDLWVSEGPHAMGRFVRFDLRELLDLSYAPSGPPRVESLPADDIVGDGRYDAWVAAGSPHEGAE